MAAIDELHEMVRQLIRDVQVGNERQITQSGLLSEIRSEVIRTNGRVGALETWRIELDLANARQQGARTTWKQIGAAVGAAAAAGGAVAGTIISIVLKGV